MSFAKNKCQQLTLNDSTFSLTGREAKDIAADFLFTEDGTEVVSCPAGNTPKSCSYNKQGNAGSHFHVINVRTARIGISVIPRCSTGQA